MRPLEPLGTTEGFGCGLFLFAFGMIFVVMGLSFMPLEIASLRSGHWELIFGVIVFVAFGVMVAWGGLADANLFLRFGKPMAAISADVRPGQTFRFTYTQPFRRSADLQWIGVFLVFREQVTIRAATRKLRTSTG